MKKLQQYAGTRTTPENYRNASACIHCCFYREIRSRCGLPDTGSDVSRPSIDVSVVKTAVCDRFVPAQKPGGK